jgi:hypothetical protein
MYPRKEARAPWAVSWDRRPVTADARFDHRTGHVGFVVDRVATGQLSFPSASVFVFQNIPPTSKSQFPHPLLTLTTDSVIKQYASRSQ